MGQGLSAGWRESDLELPILSDPNTTGLQNSSVPYSLHKAAYSGDVERVREILASAPSFEVVTRWKLQGETPMHAAIKSGNPRTLDICSLLIEADKTEPHALSSSYLLVNEPDSIGRTPFHYASALNSPQLTSKLLEWGADPRSRDFSKGRSVTTPLHVCARENSDDAITCARLILESCSTEDFSECTILRGGCWATVVHTAVTYHAHKMLKFLLDRGFPFRHPDEHGSTPLFLAVFSDDPEEGSKCVQILLDAIPSVDLGCMKSKSSKHGGTAAMAAAYLASPKVLKILLEDSRTEVLVQDTFGRRILHWALEGGYRDTKLLVSCLDLIVTHVDRASGGNVGYYLYYDKGPRGQTPIDLALSYGSLPATDYLLEAHPMKFWWEDSNLLERVYSSLPTAMVPTMNKSFAHDRVKKAFIGKTKNLPEQEKIYALANFGPIVGNPSVDDGAVEESRFLMRVTRFPEEEQMLVLTHPLVKTFVDSKWKKMQPLIWFTIMFQLLWVLVYTAIVYEITDPNCLKDNYNQTLTGGSCSRRLLRVFGWLGLDTGCEGKCGLNRLVLTKLTVVLSFLSGCVIVKEVFQVTTLQKHTYLRKPSNYVQLLLLSISVVNCAETWIWMSSGITSSWQKNLAAVGVFIAWAMLLREAEKLPTRGSYIAILRKVAFNCFKMLIFYIPLLIAFALCLGILIPGKGEYSNLFSAMVKVVVMTAGELEFESAFYSNQSPNLSWDDLLAQFAFLLLVFVSTIVLLNLLTGLAVHDIRCLLKDAEFNRIVSQLELIYALEGFVVRMYNTFGFDGLACWLNRFNVALSFSGEHSFKQEICTKCYSPEFRKKIWALVIEEEKRLLKAQT